jgi:hypothetical protein
MNNCSMTDTEQATHSPTFHDMDLDRNKVAPKLIGRLSFSSRAKPNSNDFVSFRYFMTFLFLGFGNLSNVSEAQVATRPLPPKYDLPITPESFCQGMPNVLRSSASQNVGETLSTLCNGTTPTNTLRTLINSPYTGQQGYNFLSTGDGLFVGPIPNDNYVRFNIAYSMKVQGKNAVDLLLGEELIIRDQTYANGDGNPNLQLKFEILKPDLRQPILEDNGADIAFKVKERSLRTARQRGFDTTLIHDLKLYRMFENNFDFMISIRTLFKDISTQPGGFPIIRKANVVKATIVDPQDRDSSIGIAVFNLEVYDQRGQEDRVEDIFSEFVIRDLKKIFAFHNKK